jgi:hypothetical protein
MPLLICHIGWMHLYEGLEGKPDKIVGGGRYVREHRSGHEVCNFLHCNDGYVYGHVETIKGKIDRPISIEMLGSDKNAQHIDGVDVIWTATHPQEKGRRVIGWYRDARVFRYRQYFTEYPSRQHKLDKLQTFRVRARADDAVLIPLGERTLQLGRGKGWIGQALWWFPEASNNDEVKTFIEDVQTLMRMSRFSLTRRLSVKKGNWGRNSDPERKALVEAAAIEAVEMHFAGYQIKSVEDENLGWDLEAYGKEKEPLRLEVKGLSASDLQVGLTPREYFALKLHMKGEMDNYRLCVVTGALGNNPRLYIFRYSRSAAGWVDESSMEELSARITPIEAAIVSLT